jgi:hypothetical protein
MQKQLLEHQRKENKAAAAAAGRASKWIGCFGPLV